MKTARYISAIMIMLTVGYAMAESHAPAKAWIAAGSHPKDYDMGVDRKTDLYNGKPSAFLKSNKAEVQGFGTFMQMTKPGPYAGKRVRFSAYVKVSDITSWAGLWFRIDGDGSKQLGFDNMGKRPIKGTLDWAQYSCVLDVPNEAKAIAFGILLDGTGKAWMSDIKLEPVGSDVAVTNMSADEELDKGPSNLDLMQD